MNEKHCTTLVRRRAIAPFPELDEYHSQLPCEHCSRFGLLERHHRQFRSRGGLWTPSNVALICHTCHALTTDEKLPTSGLNVLSTEEPHQVPMYTWYAGFVLLDDCGTHTELETTTLTMPDNCSMF